MDCTDGPAKIKTTRLGGFCFAIKSPIIRFVFPQNGLTIAPGAFYNIGMKKIFIGFLIVLSLAVAGCGVKTALEKPDPSYPRTYPVH